MSSDSSFAEECLKAHNAYRSKHGVPNLTLNSGISLIAQKWAENIAKTGKFAHSTPDNRKLNGESMGENIAMHWSSNNVDFTGSMATDQWYSEIKDYDFGKNKAKKDGAVIGHFTQVVWKESKEFGVGKAQAKDGKYFIVANYYPAGNYKGEYGNNVSQKK